MRDRLEGQLSGRYEIDRELGQGGMASVWLARDRHDGQLVAIKVLHDELAGAIGVDRFVREIRLTERLHHPSIVPILDSGVLPATTEPSLPWYAMPFIPGESLRASLSRETQLPVADAVHIARTVAGALAVAHAQGIVHRDIKPDNIILSSGAVYVVDFGIAKALSDTGDARLTSTGLALGTPVYMSPEQATASAVDARTDQYSLAAVLYEMLTGEPPITGPTVQAIIARRLADPVRPIRPVRPAVSGAIEAVVLRALERVPADRFPDITHFIAALDAAMIAPSGRRSLTRSRVIAAAVVVVAIGSIAAWEVAGHRAPAPAHVTDSVAVALYGRGMRAYDSRTSAGAMEAVHSFDAALARDSSFARGWVGLAKTYVRIYERGFDLPGIPRDTALARSVYAADRAIAADSTDAQAWAAQAVVRRNIDPSDVGPAIRAARRAIALDSLDGPSWHFLALSLAENGQLDSALAAWREGVHRAPRYTQGIAFLALGHWWHRDLDSAAKWGDSVVAVDPGYLLGRMTLGDILVDRGEYGRAIAAFEAARRLSSGVDVANALASRAAAEARAGRVADARVMIHEADSVASRFSPTPLHTALLLGRAYGQLGEVDRALAWLTRYTERDNLHYQLHLRCEPPLSVLGTDARYRALLLPGTRLGAC